MRSFVPDYAKYDSDGKLLLNEAYILAYQYMDGFCSRLLNVDLLIDTDLEVQVFHSSLMLGAYLDIDGNNFYELYKNIPLEIIPFLEKIIDGVDLELKPSYGLVNMDDISLGYYLFNIGSQTIRIDVGYISPSAEVDFKTELEQEFYKFHLFITNWTEGMYRQYVEKYEPKPGTYDQ